jgi:hypothetical protein
MWLGPSQLASFLFSDARCFPKYSHRANRSANVKTTPIKMPMVLSLKGIALFSKYGEA